jgi:hypothetical protein
MGIIFIKVTDEFNRTSWQSQTAIENPPNDNKNYVRKYNTWVEAPAGGTPEGTAILSTGETGGTKFLREDGDGTCSWQEVSGSGLTQAQVLAIGLL